MQVWRKISERGCSSAYKFGVFCSAVLVLSCRSDSQKPIAHLQIKERIGIHVSSSEQLKREDLEAMVKESFGRLPGFVFKEAAPGSKETVWQLGLSMLYRADTKAHPEKDGEIPGDKVYREIAIQVQLEALNKAPGQKSREQYFAETITGKNVRVFDGFNTVVKDAIDEAMQAIEVELELRDASDREIVAKLSDKNAKTRARAADLARERKIVAAVPRLIEMLGDDSESVDVVMKAIGALVSIKDERAVGPLIDSARRRSPIFLGQILFGLAEIGGKEAEAYLFTVSSGHRDAEVRQNAKDALEELEDRKRSRGEK